MNISVVDCQKEAEEDGDEENVVPFLVAIVISSIFLFWTLGCPCENDGASTSSEDDEDYREVSIKNIIWNISLLIWK